MRGLWEGFGMVLRECIRLQNASDFNTGSFVNIGI